MQIANPVIPSVDDRSHRHHSEKEVVTKHHFDISKQKKKRLRGKVSEYKMV